MAFIDGPYEEMVKRFCAAAETQDPRGELNIISQAQIELSDLKAAVAQYVLDHPASFCGECMWRYLATKKSPYGQLLSGWRLSGESEEVGQARFNLLKTLLEDRAVEELGKENIRFECVGGGHGLVDEKISAATKSLAGMQVKDEAKAKFLPPHRARQSSVSARAFTGTAASSRVAITKPAASQPVTPQPAPLQATTPQSSSTTKSIASASKSTAVDTLMLELDAENTSKHITHDLKEILKLQVLEAIDKNMDTTEARLDALVETKVAVRVKQEKINWYKESCKSLSKLQSDREMQLAQEKVQWEKETRERIKAELADEIAQREKALRNAIKAEVEVKWEQKMADEKVQWEKDCRQVYKAELQESLSRML
jgi:hypothetical protein